MADIDLTPTEEMASNAARGMELREKHGKGGTAVGVARARDIKNRKNLSPDTVRRMHSFFSRHAGNEAGGEDDAGYISFLLWGGAAGRSWAKRKSAQLDKDENAMSDTRKAIMERLGMAAHPGAKATMGMTNAGYKALADAIRRYGNSAPAAVVTQAKQMKQEPTEFTDNEVMAVIAKMQQTRSSRPGVKAKMGKATDALEYIKSSIANGKTVYVQAGSRTTKITPKTYAKWEESGKPLFKIGGDGALLMASGSSYVRLTLADEMLVRVSAMSRPGAKARFGTEVGRKGNKSAMITRDGTGTWYAYVVQRTETGIGKAEDMLGTMRAYATEDRAKRAAIKALDTSGFSRPGAKAKMGFVGTAGQAGAMAARGMQDGAAAYRAGKPAVLNRLDPKYRNWSDKDLEVYGNFWMRGWTGEQMKDMTTRDPKRGTDLPGSRFSRPGAKAKFGYEKTVTNLLEEHGVDPSDFEFRNGDLILYNHHERGRVEQALRDGMQTGEIRSTPRIISSFSRPGAKAKFGITNSASAFLKKMLREYASMKGTRWYNEAQFILENPTEHTDADVIAAVGNLKLAKSVSSRSNAKAKFSDEGVAVTDAEYEALAANAANQKRLTALGSMADYVITANDRAIRERAKAALAAAKARNDAWHKMWEQASTASEKAEVERRAKESERGMKRWKQISRSGFSRPGAKVRNAADILKIEVMDGSTVTSSMTPSDFMAYAKRSLPGIGSTSFLPDMIARFNELAEEKGMRVRVRSNLGKSKNAIREGEKVSASDDAVSRKIRKLMDEGKPQDQAVAIALDLERRGEL